MLPDNSTLSKSYPYITRSNHVYIINRAPSDHEQLCKWGNAVGKQLLAKTSSVCSSRFSQERFLEDLITGRKRLRKDAVLCNLLELSEVRGVYIPCFTHINYNQ